VRIEEVEERSVTKIQRGSALAGLQATVLVCSSLNTAGPAFATAAVQSPSAPSAAPVQQTGLEYLVGTWDIVATTPGTNESARFTYEVRPLLGSHWIAGHGRSEELNEESRDVWGRDLASGELMRIIFTGDGTYAVVKSTGWQGAKLVLEGDARSAGGVVRVRETIERLGDNEFLATWEAYRNGAWTPYSIERVTRRPRTA
jgi:hypothetical protein